MIARWLLALSTLSAATALSATATRRSPLTVAPPSNDQLVIAGKTFNSRLFLGTGKYKTAQDMADSIAASEAEVVTVAVRRVEGAVTSMLETSIDWNKVWRDSDNKFNQQKFDHINKRLDEVEKVSLSNI